MAGILDLLNSDLGKTIISGVSGSTGTDQDKTSSVLTMALPVLMKAMESYQRILIIKFDSNLRYLSINLKLFRKSYFVNGEIQFVLPSDLKDLV